MGKCQGGWILLLPTVHDAVDQLSVDTVLHIEKVIYCNCMKVAQSYCKQLERMDTRALHYICTCQQAGRVIHLCHRMKHLSTMNNTYTGSVKNKELSNSAYVYD